MVRPKSTLLLLGLVPLVLLTVACGGSDEKQLLSKFFNASRMRDNTTLGNIATVQFSPTEDGIVQSFDIAKAAPEQKRTLQLKQLKAAEEAARKDDEELNKKKKEYQDTNLDAIERVLAAERTGAKLKGKDLEVQAAWTKWRNDVAEHSKTLAEARNAMNHERSLAELSVFDARNPVDVTAFDGQLITRDILLKARVKKGEAAAADHTHHVQEGAFRYEDEDQSQAAGLRPGLRVRHPQFGVGTVVSVESGGDDAKVVVRFASVGQKKLMARFARLERA
jgi:hypothetical protein